MEQSNYASLSLFSLSVSLPLFIVAPRGNKLLQINVNRNISLLFQVFCVANQRCFPLFRRVALRHVAPRRAASFDRKNDD